jgi:hypothetical protein
MAGVEADVRGPQHRGVDREPRVLGGVLYDEGSGLADHVVAERRLAWPVAEVHRPVLGLVVLNALADQRDRCRGDTEQLLGHRVMRSNRSSGPSSSTSRASSACRRSTSSTATGTAALADVALATGVSPLVRLRVRRRCRPEPPTAVGRASCGSAGSGTELEPQAVRPARSRPCARPAGVHRRHASPAMFRCQNVAPGPAAIYVPGANCSTRTGVCRGRTALATTPHQLDGYRPAQHVGRGTGREQ